ncbi:hypothetical protein DID88_002905 [Monilinia fructigena]|uniref:Uncharacterized protein n=1 Tax=Monilinia fructigena TaxID=38457 RepID=A0A395INH4_9HELO|nr:hypothetical protein DID88_002905 [Monilinia fructigena]
MNRMGVGALDYVLLMCPSLTAFRISADFITDALFENIPKDHPLRILDLDCSGTAVDLIDTMEDLESETPLGIEPIGVWFSTD